MVITPNVPWHPVNSLHQSMPGPPVLHKSEFVLSGISSAGIVSTVIEPVLKSSPVPHTSSMVLSGSSHSVLVVSTGSLSSTLVITDLSLRGRRGLSGCIPCLASSSLSSPKVTPGSISTHLLRVSVRGILFIPERSSIIPPSSGMPVP